MHSSPGTSSIITVNNFMDFILVLNMLIELIVGIEYIN